MLDTPSPFAAGQSVTPTREDVAGALERLAEVTGDDAFRRAARALYQERPGQKPVDDCEALAEAETLLRDGVARSMWHAFCLVARTRGRRDQVRSIAERLRRKHSALKKSSTE